MLPSLVETYQSTNIMLSFRRFLISLDWILLASAGILVFFGLVTMKTFGVPGEMGNDYFFWRQLIWFVLGLFAFFIAARIDWGFFKTNSIFLLIGYFVGLSLLLFLLFSNAAVRGSARWIQFGFFSVDPAEPMKLLLIFILAKYFSRRHIAIARIGVLVISGFYVAFPAVLIFLQPDFGTTAVLGFLWLGMALVGGIRVRHLLALLLLGAISALVAWSLFLLPYQKARIISFIDPYQDARGAGYHALQSMIAVGSGGMWGRGIGLGTQSRLAFLPEHETDFIFAAFAEEWGFAGVSLLMFFYGVVLWRIARAGMYAESNFEKLCAAGAALVLFFQSAIHIGMNIGMFPITGLGLPLVSYGGSSLATTFFTLGVLESFSIHRHRRGIFLGVEERYQEGIVGS